MIPQAGAIVFRIDDGLLRVLLVRSKKNPSMWVLPKGHIEPGERPVITALREAFEEAGVTGLAIGSAGRPITFQSGSQIVSVEYFVVELTAETASPERREKIWLEPHEAEERLVFPDAKQLLRNAVVKITSRT